VLQKNIGLSLCLLAQMSQNIVGIIFSNQVSVLSFEILAQGFLIDSSGVVGGVADFVLHLEFAREIIFFGSEGLGGR